MRTIMRNMGKDIMLGVRAKCTIEIPPVITKEVQKDKEIYTHEKNVWMMEVYTKEWFVEVDLKKIPKRIEELPPDLDEEEMRELMNNKYDLNISKHATREHIKAKRVEYQLDDKIPKRVSHKATEVQEEPNKN